MYGTIGSSNANKVPPQTTYQLDGGSDVTYIPELTASAQHYQRFYQSAQVSDGNHTLFVTNIIGGCDPYFVDYLVIQKGSNSTSSTMGSMPTGSTGHSNTGHRAGVIAGSVFGVIGGILLFALAYYFLIRRRWKRKLGVSTEEVSSSKLWIVSHRLQSENTSRWRVAIPRQSFHESKTRQRQSKVASSFISKGFGGCTSSLYTLNELRSQIEYFSFLGQVHTLVCKKYVDNWPVLQL